MKNRELKLKIGGCGAGRHGFTIVELLLVAAVIALIAGLGGGLWVGTYNKMQVEKAARNFSLAAKYAKITAIEQQMPCKLQLDKENKKFALLVYALNEQSGATELIPVRERMFSKAVELGGDVEFERISIKSNDPSASSENDGQNVIVFAPDGTAQDAIVQIGDGKNHYTASISASTGRVKMVFGTVADVKTGTVDLDSAGL